MEHRPERFPHASATRALEQEGAMALPPWLHRSEAFAEDVQGLVTPLPQWRADTPKGRVGGAHDGAAATTGGFVYRLHSPGVVDLARRLVGTRRWASG